MCHNRDVVARILLFVLTHVLVRSSVLATTRMPNLIEHTVDCKFGIAFFSKRIGGHFSIHSLSSSKTNIQEWHLR